MQTQLAVASILRKEKIQRHTMFGQAGIAWAILSGMGWRWLLGISSFPLLMLLLLFPFIPESPYYLAVIGQQAKAEAILQKVAAVNKSSLPPGVLSQPVAASKHVVRLCEYQQGFACIGEIPTPI